MSYTTSELNALTYVVTFFESSDYKFLAPLIRKEFGNVRTSSAYQSRMYCMRKDVDLNKPNQTSEFNKLDLKFNLLKKALKPEPDPRININLVQAQYHHYRIETKQNYGRMRKLLEEEKNKVKELESKLENENQQAGLVMEQLEVLKTRITNFGKPKLERKNVEIKTNPMRMPNKSYLQVVEQTLVKEEEEEKQEELPKREPVKVRFDENFLRYFHQVENDMIPKSIKEWKKTPLKTKPTHPVYVKSETDESKMYKVRHIGKTNSFHCECLSWKYQHVPPTQRTCKHINAVFGKSKNNKKN